MNRYRYTDRFKNRQLDRYTASEGRKMYNVHIGGFRKIDFFLFLNAPFTYDKLFYNFLSYHIS